MSFFSSWHGRRLSPWKVGLYTLGVFALGVQVDRVLHKYQVGPLMTGTNTHCDNAARASANQASPQGLNINLSRTNKQCDNAAIASVNQAFPQGLNISLETRCPRSNAWLHEFLNTYPSTDDDPFIFLNLGCNKGYDSIRVAKAVTRNEAIFRKDLWRTAIQVEYSACGQDVEHDPPLDPTLPKQPVIVHCVEAMPTTVEKLQFAATTTKANKHGLMIHNYALTGTRGGGSILFPNTEAGTEYLGLADCNRPDIKDRCLEVPSITVDEFASKYIDNENKKIPYVSIDVEGYDFTIMKAALETLKRTEYLEFEFHQVGDWSQQKLKDATDMLQLEAGFVCYWAGVNRLWRITDCWVDVYGSFHDWSNIACVAPERAPALAGKMDEVFETTLVS